MSSANCPVHVSPETDCVAERRGLELENVGLIDCQPNPLVCQNICVPESFGEALTDKAGPNPSVIRVSPFAAPTHPCGCARPPVALLHSTLGRPARAPGILIRAGTFCNHPMSVMKITAWLG